MKKPVQKVIQQNKLTNLLLRLLLLTTCCGIHLAYADTAKTTNQLPVNNKNQVVILYSPYSTLQSNIAKSLLNTSLTKHSNITVLTSTPENKKISTNKETDVVIVIGSKGIPDANRQHPETNKLFISTAPEKYNLNVKSKSKNAILYMAQTYCRQIQFIKLLSDKWKTIGLLNSQEKPIHNKAIQQCAKKYNLETYIVNTTSDTYLRDSIKIVLNNSDILLALPDKNIYNSKSVKNILLTSYRYRKPVIAFSKNFVNAGALASIYSDADQIAQSASDIIEKYFELEGKFEKTVNYPQAFNASINLQVFRALDLTIPNIEKIKQMLKHSETKKPGTLQ